MGIPILSQISKIENKNSINYSAALSQKIIHQDIYSRINLKEHNNIRNNINNQSEDIKKHKLEELRGRTPNELKRENEIASMKGSSNWINSLPLKSEGYNLNKREFFDTLPIRYRWTPKRLPKNCACGKKFNIDHALTCMKG